MQVPTALVALLAACIVNVAAHFHLNDQTESCATNATPSSWGVDIEQAGNISSVCNALDREATIKSADGLCAGLGNNTLPTAATCWTDSSACSSSSSSPPSTVSAASAISSSTAVFDVPFSSTSKTSSTTTTTCVCETSTCRSGVHPALVLLSLAVW